MCYAAARYAQRQQFHLDSTGQLLLVDWLSCGRQACGEQWAFDHYESRNEIFVAGQRLVSDTLRLSPQEGPLNSPDRLGGIGCLATVLIVGGPDSPFAREAQDIFDWSHRQPVTSLAPLKFAVSPLYAPGQNRTRHAGGGTPHESCGLMLRVAGPQVEAVGQFIQTRLKNLTALLQDNPWSRKW